MSDAECWRTIGVGGDGSCPELKRHLHCHNCPVWADASRSFFGREPPPGYDQEWSDLLADEGRTEGTGQRSSVVVFRLGAEWLGVDALLCGGVADAHPPRPIPRRTNRIFLGMIAVRGRLELCVSLRQALGIEGPPPPSGPWRVLVLDVDGRRWVTPIDEMAAAISYAHEQASAVPRHIARGSSASTQRVFVWEGREVGHLDVHRLLATFEASIR